MTNTRKEKAFDFLTTKGEMAQQIRDFDWTKTPLGPPTNWSPSLRSVISVMLANRFPMLLWWGKEYIQFYNDPYIPIPGLKHPKALGQPGHECWEEIWDILRPLVDTPYNGEGATWMDDILLELNRKNFIEETHFIIAYSAVPDETVPKGIGGVLATVNEITNQIINERTFNTLRKVSTYTAKCNVEKDVFEKTTDALGENPYDFPFALLYKLDEEGKQAQLFATSQIEKGSSNASLLVDLSNNQEDKWNIREVVETGQALLVEDLQHYDDLPTGYWSVPPSKVLVTPVFLQGKRKPYAVFIAALNPRRQFDDNYKSFLHLVTEQIAQALSNVHAIDEERKRAEALEEIDRSKTVFFSNISHEFRTPITLMLGPLEELMNKPKSNLNNVEKQYIETTHRNAMRLLKLVNTLLDFSRIESGRHNASYILTDISFYTRNLTSNFRSVFERAGLKLIVNAERIVQPVYLDLQMWEKIVFNLLSNAFKYTLKGSITVTVSMDNNHAVLMVEDTGVGIPEKELPHMFERFHRVDKVVGRTFEGSGIGLSLIKEFVQLHSGTITVQSQEGKGSKFTVSIPFGKEHLPQEKIITHEQDFQDVMSNPYVEEIETLLETALDPSKTRIKGKTGEATILIVDDNADMRQHIESVIGKRYRTITATNGMDALHKINEFNPTLILSDIMMPIMDGTRLLKEVKQNPKTAMVPVILITARAGEESRIEGYDTGADDYLVKPFAAKELMARIDVQISIAQKRSTVENQLRHLFEQAPIAIQILRGSQFVYELANERSLQIMGKTKEEVLGKRVVDVMPETQQQGFIGLLQNVYATGERYVADEVPYYFTRDGERVDIVVKFVFQPLKDEDGTITGIMVTGDDITEKTLLRRKIEAKEKHLKDVLN